jgi:hypothetical protein
MADHVHPEFAKDAFNCAICNAYSEQIWSIADGIDMGRAVFGQSQMSTGHIEGLAFSQCKRCKKFSVWTRDKKSLVYPRLNTRVFDLTHVPKTLADDFSEACLVIQDSPKASAALSRRCLQATLRDRGHVAHTLHGEIQSAISSGLPSHIADDLDAVRNIGNFAAHPTKDTNSGAIVDVEPGEADWNLDILEALFDFYYIQPVKSQARKAALNTKLTTAGKPTIP